MYSLANFLKTFNIILTLPLICLDGLFDPSKDLNSIWTNA